jgi:hypothetical protein
MKNITFIIPFFFILLLSCTTNNKEREMQEVTVYENYTVKLPLQANLVKKNRWKIESSTNLTTIIISELTQANSIANCMNETLMMHDSGKFKLYLNTEKVVDKPDFKVYIKDYKGKAGVSPISFTCVILDELNSQNRFIFELNSIGFSHVYIMDSIVGSFKKL